VSVSLAVNDPVPWSHLHLNTSTVLLFYTASTSPLEIIQPPIPLAPKALFLRTKRPGREVLHQLPMPRFNVRGGTPPYAFIIWRFVLSSL